MNIRQYSLVLLASCVFPAFSLAALPPPPSGLETGAALSASGFPAAEWDLPATATREDTSITVISEKSNPRLRYRPALSGDILVQARLLRVNSNHSFRLLLNDNFAIGFSSQFRKVFLQSVEGGHKFLTPPLAEIPYLDGRIPADDQADFVLTLAVRGSEVTVWIDSRELAQVTVPGLGSPCKLTFVSGWNSNWALADFAVHSLKPAR